MTSAAISSGRLIFDVVLLSGWRRPSKSKVRTAAEAYLSRSAAPTKRRSLGLLFPCRARNSVTARLVWRFKGEI